MHAMKKCLSWTSAVCPARNISTTTGLIVMKFEIQKRKPFWVTVTTMRLACLVLDVSTSMWWINIKFATDNHVSIRMNFNHCGDGRSFYSSSIIKSDFSLSPNTLIITNKPIPWWIKMVYITPAKHQLQALLCLNTTANIATDLSC